MALLRCGIDSFGSARLRGYDEGDWFWFVFVFIDSTLRLQNFATEQGS